MSSRKLTFSPALLPRAGPCRAPDGSRAASASRETTGETTLSCKQVDLLKLFQNSWGSNTNNEAKPMGFHMIKPDMGIFSVQKRKEKSLSLYIFICFILRKDDLDTVA